MHSDALPAVTDTHPSKMAMKPPLQSFPPRPLGPGRRDLQNVRREAVALLLLVGWRCGVVLLARLAASSQPLFLVYCRAVQQRSRTTEGEEEDCL